MVGVHRLQALLAAHATSAGLIPSWVHWPQAPIAFFIALFISYISLLLGFHHKGRPFGSRKATAWTITLIAVTALLAAVLSILVPHLPLSLGVFIPALLCGAVLKENESIEELRIANAELAAIVTIGISYFLSQAREQMADDRANWCEKLIDQFRSRDQYGAENELASLNNFSVAAGQLRTGLVNRLPDGHRDLAAIIDNGGEIDPAIRAADQARKLGNTQLFREEYNKAEEPLTYLLQLAYNWKYTDFINLAVITNPPPRLKVIEDWRQPAQGA